MFESSANSLFVCLHVMFHSCLRNIYIDACLSELSLLQIFEGVNTEVVENGIVILSEYI